MSEKRDIFINLSLTDDKNLSMTQIRETIEQILEADGMFTEVSAEIFRIDMQELACKFPEHHEVNRK